MKKLILLFLLCGVLSPLDAQTEKKFNLKYWKDQALDTSIIINNSFKSKNTTYNLLVGYGQTIGKSGFTSNNSWGKFGTGILNSDLSRVINTMGPEYSLIKDFGWGKNGAEMGFSIKNTGFKLDATYSGYYNIGLLNFESPANSSFFTRGLITYSEDKIKDMRFSIDFKF